MYVTPQGDLTVVLLDRDRVGIDLRVAPESGGDLVLQPIGGNTRLHPDRVPHTHYATQVVHRLFGTLALIVPLHRAFERYLAVLYGRFDLLPGNGQVRLQGRDGIPGQLRIRDAFSGCQAHFDVVGQCRHACNTLGGVGGAILLCVTTDKTRQCYHAIVDLDGDVRVFDLRFPVQLRLDVMLDCCVSFHVRPSISNAAFWSRGSVPGRRFRSKAPRRL